MVSHDLSVYSCDPYHMENVGSMRQYATYVQHYTSDTRDFLELGIGHAETIKYLSEIFYELVVVDCEKRLIDKSREQYRNIQFVCDFFERYRPSRLFWNIGMGFILEHVDNPEGILKKYADMLHPDGKIFVSVPNASSLHRIIAHHAGLLDDIKMMSETDRRYGHVRFNTYAEWMALFASCNLTVNVSHGLFLKPFTTKQIHSLCLDIPTYEALFNSAKDLPSIANTCFFVLQKHESVKCSGSPAG